MCFPALASQFSFAACQGCGVCHAEAGAEAEGEEAFLQAVSAGESRGRIPLYLQLLFDTASWSEAILLSKGIHTSGTSWNITELVELSVIGKWVVLARSASQDQPELCSFALMMQAGPRQSNAKNLHLETAAFAPYLPAWS